MGSLFGGKPKMPKPTTPDYAKATGNILGVYESTTPRVQEFERMAREGYGALNLGDIAGAMFGIGGEQGIIGQTGQAAAQAQQQIQGLRAGEYGAMTGQAGAVRGLIGEMSPESQRMMQLQAQQAEQAYARSQGLSPQEQRSAQQGARESFTSAGRLGGNLGIVGEAMGREDILAQKRQEAAGRIGQAYQTSQSFYSPVLGLLGSTPTSYGMGQQTVQYGAAMLGRSTPGLINPDVGLNLAAAGRRDLLGAQSAQAQARATEKAGMMSMFGNILSDINAKTEIKKIGVTDGGLPVYTYRYKTGGPIHMGVMAQEAEVNHPDSVIEVDGFKMVDYSKIK